MRKATELGTLGTAVPSSVVGALLVCWLLGSVGAIYDESGRALLQMSPLLVLPFVLACL